VGSVILKANRNSTVLRYIALCKRCRY